MAMLVVVSKYNAVAILAGAIGEKSWISDEPEAYIHYNVQSISHFISQPFCYTDLTVCLPPSVTPV